MLLINFLSFGLQIMFRSSLAALYDFLTPSVNKFIIHLREMALQLCFGRFQSAAHLDSLAASHQLVPRTRLRCC